MMRQRLMAMLPRFFVIVAAVVILGAALGAGSALAAKGGIGASGKGNGGTIATLVVSPDPVAAYTHPTVSGAGFKAGESLLVGIPGDLRFTSVTADSTGAISFEYTARDLVPGSYSMEAWGQARKGYWVFKAGSNFTVVP